jgi:hypothetical protein
MSRSTYSSYGQLTRDFSASRPNAYRAVAWTSPGHRPSSYKTTDRVIRSARSTPRKLFDRELASNANDRSRAPTASMDAAEHSAADSQVRGGMAASRSMDYDQISRKSMSNIISAFHDLQLKLKVVERERYQAIEEREMIKQSINKLKRELALWRNKNDYDVTDNLLSSKTMFDRARVDCQSMQAKVKHQEDVSKSIQDLIKAQESNIASITSDIDLEAKARLYRLEERHRRLQEEYDQISARNKLLNEHLDEIVTDTHTELKSSINSLEGQLEDVVGSNERESMKIDSLKRYIEFIISMNNDLCETLIHREESKANILRLAEKFKPPHYAWPKKPEKVTYDQIMNLVNASATKAALEKKLSLSPSIDKKRASMIVDSIGLKARKRTGSRGGSVEKARSSVERLERRAASAIARATTAANVLSYGTRRSSGSNQGSRSTSRSHSRSSSVDRKVSSARRSGSGPLLNAAFIPTSPSRESKEFNRIAIESSRHETV